MQTRRKLIASVAGLALLTAACGTGDVLVTSERSDQIGVVEPEPPTTDEPTEPDPTTTVPDRNSPLDPIDPVDPMGDPVIPDIDPAALDPNAIDFGENKPPRDYDDFLLASLADIDAWFAAEFEPVFGEPFVPLEGSVVAGYPERTDDLPGCGEPSTSYEDLQLFVAFYCPIGDFIIYDDGETGLLATLAAEFGPATIGIVLAHEYGHAIQERIGALQLDLPTVTTEQQADCIAGAWAGRAAAGQAPGVPFTDADVRAGLIAMIEVEDPVGTNPTDPGGHGSGFDRIGAFQVGFQEGLARCAELIDAPLPLIPLTFSEADLATQGNAPFGFGETELFGFLVPDLNLYYDADRQADFPNFAPLELVSTQTVAEVDCAEPFGLYELGVELCSDTNTAYLNEPLALTLYEEFGDFAPGYLLGVVWAEAAQRSQDSQLTGEARQLQNDCLVGAWVQSVIPDATTESGLPEPRDVGRTASISPGDLTEAVQTSIIIGDPAANTDVLGSAFEKINSFRQGVLGGLTACV
jgi:predicted metalloprotease